MLDAGSTCSLILAVSRETLLDLAPACRLGPFLTVLRTRDYGKLLQFIQKSLSWHRSHSFPKIPFCLNRGAQYHRRVELPSAADWDEANRVALPFSGDKEDGPPLAWATMWKGAVSNVYGFAIPTSVQAWGYVFWDAQRFVESGGKRRVEDVVEAWSGYDPRYP